ncbi:MAG: SLBB domain-containing protein, partial [Candidatus Heimdallarchaeota archaeon]|nr:SLBB domain-containing protein [Candidatus Heimdallarchaeota archaeon]
MKQRFNRIVFGRFVLGIILCRNFSYAKDIDSLPSAEEEIIKQKIKSGDISEAEVRKNLEKYDDFKVEELATLDRTSESEDLKEKISTVEQIFSKDISFEISRNIKQFGYDIFQSSSTFAPVDNVPVGPDYIIGAGDNMIVYIWGKVVQETFNVTVDQDGKINLPKSGNIYVWGLPFTEAEKLIKNTLSEQYANLQISVTMGKLRTIKVFVLGDVEKAGAYTISALSTVFHAVYESGGPTKLGSMRSVKLIRNNEVVDIIDLYEFLLEGNKSRDYKLQSGDTVFVPSIGEVAGIAGNVKRPGIYELKDKVKVSDLLALGGGLTPIGYLQRVQLERIKNRQRRVIIDLKLDSIDDLADSEKNIPVQDGDLVSIFSVLSQRYNFVSVEGNVLRPGDYEFIPLMTVNDLIKQAGGVEIGTYLERAEVYRVKDNRSKEVIPVNLSMLLKGDEKEDLQLKEWDKLVVYSNGDILPERQVEISGAIYKPGEYDITPNMKLNDLIFRAGGLKPTASLNNAELYRICVNNGSKIMKIDLSGKGQKSIIQKGILLEESDHLYVREESEYKRKKIITLKGDVKFPGEYVAEKNESLSSIIARAGGFTEEAFLKGTVFTRESVKQIQKSMVERFIKTETKEVLREEAQLQKSNMNQFEREEKITTFQRRKELLELISNLDIPG